MSANCSQAQGTNNALRFHQAGFGASDGMVYNTGVAWRKLTSETDKAYQAHS